MLPPSISFTELNTQLDKSPVMVIGHPLLPLALDPSVNLCTDASALLASLDDRYEHPGGKMCVLDYRPELVERIPARCVPEQPPAKAINQNLAARLEYIRSHLLTNHRVADWIVAAVSESLPQLIALFLVDGLSYADVQSWPCQDVQPCFVDSPSVTYRFLGSGGRTVNPSVGFAALVGQPSLFTRLQKLGYNHARGYTYWSPGRNAISDHLFLGVPYQRIANFESILHLLKKGGLREGSYLQIVREGLDGLAHSKRELHRIEIDSAIQAIWHDVGQLADVFAACQLHYLLVVVADHGILWKNEHQWLMLGDSPTTHPRYSTVTPAIHSESHFIRIECANIPYYLCHYPYLAAAIPADDSGVHGGLSFQESFVPLITLRG